MEILNIGGTAKAAITCPNVSWTTSVYHKEAAQRVRKKSIQKDIRLKLNFFIVETPIPKAKRSRIGKLNNPAQLAAEPVSKACLGVHTRDFILFLRKEEMFHEFIIFDDWCFMLFCFGVSLLRCFHRGKGSYAGRQKYLAFHFLQ
jgi:hypothetical protein